MTMKDIGLGILGTLVVSILYAMFYEYTAYGVLGLMLYFFIRNREIST